MAQYPATATSTKLPVTKANTAGEAILATGTVTSGAPSAWVQISASLAADTVVTAVQAVAAAAGFGTTAQSYIEIGYGGAGSETVVATAPLQLSYDGASKRLANATLGIPVRVASGQRLAIRISDNSGTSGSSVALSVYGVPYANLEGN